MGDSVRRGLRCLLASYDLPFHLLGVRGGLRVLKRELSRYWRDHFVMRVKIFGFLLKYEYIMYNKFFKRLILYL